MAHPSRESAQSAGRKRWEGKTPAQRTEGMRPAHQARATVADVDAKVELLGAAMLDQFAALRAELAALRAQREQSIAA
jgi:hypothetical protein